MASIYLAASATASRTAATAIGMGMANTTAIVARHVGVDTSTYAAGMADALTFGGQSDWFLPSKDELEMYIQKTTVGGFVAGIYWSSSEVYHELSMRWLSYAWGRGRFADQPKAVNSYVRPVRAF